MRSPRWVVLGAAFVATICVTIVITHGQDNAGSFIAVGFYVIGMSLLMYEYLKGGKS